MHHGLHWDLEDPAEVVGDDATKLAAFRETYEDLEVRIRSFVDAALRTAGRGRPASS
jgi:hypothetical protein